MSRPVPATALAEELAAVAAGDEAALERVYRATVARLHGIVVAIVGRRDWAEDVTQEAYVRIWRQAHRYAPARGRPMTWMIAIARNAAIDRLRAEGARPQGAGDELLLAVADPAPGPEAAALNSDAAARIDTCLGELGEQQRVCIRLAYWHGYTHSELAERFAVPLGTLKSWVRRGLQQLRDCLER